MPVDVMRSSQDQWSLQAAAGTSSAMICASAFDRAPRLIALTGTQTAWAQRSTPAAATMLTPTAPVQTPLAPSATQQQLLHALVRAGDLASLQSALAARTHALDAADEHGNTVLHIAALLGRIDLITALRAAGASNSVSNKRSELAVDWAVRNGHPEAVPVLLSNNITKVSVPSTTSTKPKQSSARNSVAVATNLPAAPVRKSKSGVIEGRLWSHHTDAEGNVYYVNNDTNVAQWSEPSDFRTGVRSKRKVSWIACTDAEGSVYWYTEKTGESR